MEPSKLSIEEAHRFAGELFFAFKLLEKDFKRLGEINQATGVANEQLKGENFSLKKQLQAQVSTSGTL